MAKDDGSAQGRADGDGGDADGAPMSDEKDLDGISRDENPGPIELEPEDFVTDVAVDD